MYIMWVSAKVQSRVEAWSASIQRLYSSWETVMNEILLAIISVIGKSCRSNFMHTGIALCFCTPYNTGFLLIHARTCNHQTYIYSSRLILVSLFSAVNQTLSWTKVVTQYLFGDSNLAIIVYSDTRTRVQLGRKYCKCLHNTMSDHTCDFSG